MPWWDAISWWQVWTVIVELIIISTLITISSTLRNLSLHLAVLNFIADKAHETSEKMGYLSDISGRVDTICDKLGSIDDRARLNEVIIPDDDY